jgi:alpha,alpha-trehalase
MALWRPNRFLFFVNTNSGQQWGAPNGSAPLQWIGFHGLVNYRFDELAEKIRINWLEKVGDIYKIDGKLTKKHNVMSRAESGGGGEYPNQDCFGWTNGKYFSL